MSIGRNALLSTPIGQVLLGPAPGPPERRTGPTRWTSSVTPTCPSPPRSTGSSPTRSSRAACSPGSACPRSGSSARPCASTPTPCAPSTTLADAGYVIGRHGAGTRVVDRPPVRRGSDALAGIVAETLRRAAQLGFTPDEVAQATFTAATERKRPGPLVRVLFAECTRPMPTWMPSESSKPSPSGSRHGHPARRAPGAPRPIPLRSRRDHDVPRGRGAGLGRRARAGGRDARRPRVHVADPRDRRLAARFEGGLVCGYQRGVENIAEVLGLAGATGIETDLGRRQHGGRARPRWRREADLVLLSREACRPGPRGPIHPPRAPPRVELRVRPGGLRAAPPRDRAGGRQGAGRAGLRLVSPSGSWSVRAAGSLIEAHATCWEADWRAGQAGTVRDFRHASSAPLPYRALPLRPRRVAGAPSAPAAPAAGARAARLAANLPAARRVVAAVDARRPPGEPSAQAGELGRAGAPPRDLPPAGRERAAELEPAAAMAGTAAVVEEALGGLRAGRAARRRRRGVPGRGVGCRGGTARGDAPGPDRQREPGSTPAARARGRPGPARRGPR